MPWTTTSSVPENSSPWSASRIWSSWTPKTRLLIAHRDHSQDVGKIVKELSSGHEDDLTPLRFSCAASASLGDALLRRLNRLQSHQEHLIRISKAQLLVCVFCCFHFVHRTTPNARASASLSRTRIRSISRFGVSIPRFDSFQNNAGYTPPQRIAPYKANGRHCRANPRRPPQLLPSKTPSAVLLPGAFCRSEPEKAQTRRPVALPPAWPANLSSSIRSSAAA